MLTQEEVKIYFGAYDHADNCSRGEYIDQLHDLLAATTKLLWEGDDRKAPLSVLAEIQAEASRRLYGVEIRTTR